MTPISPVPNHENDKQSSTVFHRDQPGKVVAKFFGPNHRSDANEFVHWFQDLPDKQKHAVESVRAPIYKAPIDTTIKQPARWTTAQNPSSRPLDAE